MQYNTLKYKTLNINKLTIEECINLLYNGTNSNAKKIAISNRIKKLVKYIDYIEAIIPNGKYTLEKENNIIIINYYLKSTKQIYLFILDIEETDNTRLI